MANADGSCGNLTTYIVQPGDWVWKIARSFGITGTQLIAANPMSFAFGNTNFIVPGVVLCVPPRTATNPVPSGVGTGGANTQAGCPPYRFAFPTFRIVSVERDVSVAIESSNLPACLPFEVRLNTYGTRGLNGYVDKTLIEVPFEGVHTIKVAIPSQLKGLNRIAIRIDNAATGYFAYNWFWNNTTPAGTGGAQSPTNPPAPACNLGNGAWNPAGIPRFWIASVDGGKSVTILTENFPPSTDFEVRMGAYGTAGVGGAVVGITNSCKGGAFRATYNLPAGLQSSRRIAVRLENYFTGYFAYNWFWNSTAVAIP
jgi:hypothetical protein